MVVTNKVQAHSDLHELGECAQSPSSILSPGHRQADIYHFAFIDQICVVDGVCHKEEMQDSNDLIVGDEYRFPSGSEQAQSEILLNGNEASVRIINTVEIGFSRFSAIRTHKLTMISDIGHVVEGHVLSSPGGRVVIALQEQADPTKSYSLIAVSPAITN